MNNETIKTRKKKALNNDLTITMRIPSDLLEEFKIACVGSYQKKIRELMKQYIERTNEIEKKEQEIKLKNLNVEKYVNMI